MRVSARSSCTCFCDSDLAATVIFSHLRMTDRRLKRRSPVRWTVLLSKKIRRTSWTTYAHSPTHICAHTRSCACFKVTFSTAYVHTCALNHSRTSTSTRSLTPTYTCTWPPQVTTTTETNTDKVKFNTGSAIDAEPGLVNATGSALPIFAKFGGTVGSVTAGEWLVCLTILDPGFSPYHSSDRFADALRDVQMAPRLPDDFLFRSVRPLGKQ